MANTGIMPAVKLVAPRYGLKRDGVPFLVPAKNVDLSTMRSEAA